ncbi:multidrug resistance-associated protein 5-like [Gigantopelta aegis]|uniref:multidrug resistance-associated protein 5-like n=1 Tax=Gigantopelta aegis TaxID=1735272 RepID=UPI001B88D109|nr:multidrug resistance-associated protein 5-like [Gigantopelta aegis]
MDVHGKPSHSSEGKAGFRSINQTYARHGSSQLGIDRIPITRIGIFSIATLSWLTPIMWSLYRRGIGSVLCLTWWEEDTAQYNVDRLGEFWEKERRKHGAEKCSFGRAIRHTFKTRLICSEIVVMLAIAFSFIGSAFILRLLLDHISESSPSVGEGVAIVVGLIISELCRCLFFSLAWCLNYWNGIKVRGAAMGLLYKKILRLRSLKDKKIGELVNLCSNDGQRFFEVMVNGPFIMAGPVIFIIGSIYLGFLIGPWALIGCATYLAFFVLLKFVSDLMEKFRSTAVSLTGERVSLMTEVLTCMKLIKMNAWEKPFKQRISEKRMSEKTALEHSYFLQSIITSLVPMVPLIASGFMFISLILSGNDLKVSEAFTIIALLYSISLSLGLATHGVRTLAEATVAARRYKEILLMDEIADGQREITEDGVSVKMSNATFSWEGQDDDDDISVEAMIGGISKEEILQSFRKRLASTHKEETHTEVDDNEEMENSTPLLGSLTTVEKTTSLAEIDFIIKTGELVGICGMRGSGKSSVLSALLGQMKLQSGKFAVKGRIAYVSQEPWIINGTARENILFGKVKDEERYKAVIEACCLDKDFDTFGAGDCVEIGERGLNISGGQKQRISLARALYSDSDIYLLDDPMSSLDIHIGRHVFTHGIKKLLKGKTVLFVTHHLEYLSRCHLVVLMNGGRIVEMGSHSELIDANCDYSDLMSLYYSKYEQIQKERIKSTNFSREGRTTPQRGFSRLSRKVLSRQLSRMTTTEGLQHQYSIISTSSTVYGDYDYVDIDDLVAGQEMDNSQVTFDVYKMYISNAGGYCIVLLIFIMFATSIGIQTSATWWLAYWLEQGDGNASSINNSTHHSGSVADHPDVRLYALVYGLFIISMLIIVAIRGLVFMKVLLRAASRLHKQLLQRTMHSPMKFFDKTPLGKIINRFAADMDEVDVRLPSNLELYLQNILLVFFALVMICVLFPWDLLAILPLSIVFFVLAYMFTPILQRLKFIDNLTRSPYLGHLAASVEGISTINVYGQADSFVKQFCDMLDMNTIPFFLFYAANRWLALFLDLMTIAVIGVTGFLVVLTVTPKTRPRLAWHCLLHFSFITSLLQYTLRLSVETGARFSSVQRITDYIENLQTEGNPAGQASPVPATWPSEGYITFSKFRMRYSDGLPLVLKGISLNIQPRQKIGIVGKSGSGKSSLGVALFRLSEAASGAITIDGRNIRDVELTDLRSRLTILVQDPVLFEGTVRYNLDPSGCYHSDDLIWEALAKCHIKEKVVSLQNKLDTLVEENGRNFSTGEKQLLCLARALLRHTKILILDEATASVDTRTESLVQQTIQEVFEDCTVLTIAHRLVTILDCDKVLVMDDGKVMEFDSPKVLLAKRHSKFKTMIEALKTHPKDSVSEDTVIPLEVSDSLPKDPFPEDSVVSSLSYTDKTEPWFS